MEPIRAFSRSIAVAFGLVCVAAGTTPALQAAGLLAAAPDTSRWAMVSAGLIFLTGGAAIIVDYALAPAAASGGTSRVVPVIQYVLSLVVTAAVTVVAAWIAVGPGERGFAVAVPFLPGAASELIGRAAFIVTAMLTFCVFLLFAVAGAVELRTK